MVVLFVLSCIAVGVLLYIVGIAFSRAYLEKKQTEQEKARRFHGDDLHCVKISRDMIELGGFFWIFALPYIVAKVWFLKRLYPEVEEDETSD